MTNQELGHLFGLFRSTILSDLSDNGIPSSVVGSLLNWFDPAKPEYLTHVSAWKELLARGACFEADVPRVLLEWKVVRQTSYHTLIFEDKVSWKVLYVNLIANLFYKAHCPPRQETDWESVKLRLSSPPELSLTHRDIRRLRNTVRCLDDCPDVDGLGSYGPGITCDGLSSFERWNREGNIPPVPPNWYRWNMRDDYTPRVDSEIRYTRIAEVPKTLKSNRIISSEPAQSMFAQKAVASWMDHRFMRFFSNHVTLHDQSFHNRYLRDPEYRTIDLSDASDYVSCDLVSRVLPALWPLLASIRSTHALFPDGELVPLRTFAPMGSGLCFPILTAVNLAICNVACHRPFSVYGDDVIAHRDDIVSVMEWQAACGLRLNQAKTCLASPFRESCGVEMFDDLEVTPLYIRERIDLTDWKKAEELVEAFLYRYSMPSTAALVARIISGGKPPRLRANPAYQRREVLVPVYIRVDRERKLDGYAGLRKWYLTRNETRPDQESLVIAGKGRLKRVCRYRPETDYPTLLHLLGTQMPL